MSLHYLLTTVTPFEVAALHNVIAAAPDSDDKQTAYRWLCHVRSELFREWRALPDGHHLKDAYRNDVWTWDDQDLAAPRTVTPNFKRPTFEEIEEGIAKEFPELSDG